ncbi:MAG: hypothetical protein EBX28_11940, partial [Betaproteobacteria bacterium]|nr:hypothetical protein [Betaproteobacteria bacterium]
RHKTLRALFGFEIQAFTVEILEDPDKEYRLAFDARIFLLVLLDKAAFTFPPQTGGATVLIRVDPSGCGFCACLSLCCGFATE